VHPVTRAAVAVALAIALGACGGSTKSPKTKKPKTGVTKPMPKPKPVFVDGVQTGMATWYGKEQHGGPTASGERFDMNQLTAAHRTLPMNTRVRVTNKKNGRQVIVRINDRGPYSGASRIIDVSAAAARILGMIDAGVVPCVVEILK
jgi:rare lipoprotein A